MMGGAHDMQDAQAAADARTCIAEARTPPGALAAGRRAHPGARGARDDARRRGHVLRRSAPTRSRRSASSSGIRCSTRSSRAYSRPQLLVKAGAADPDRHRPVARLQGRDLEHRRRGAIHHRRGGGRRRRARLLPDRKPADLPADGAGRRARRLGLGDDPGAPEDPASAPTRSWCRLMLVYVAENILASRRHRAAAQPRGQGFPGSRNLARDFPAAANPELIAGTGHALGRGRGLRSR